MTSKIKIVFESESNILSITDNGIGMSDEDVNNYVVRVGHTYYESKQFLSEQLEYQPISHFGIGMLSCFMVADEIQIESLKYSIKPQNIEAINVKLKINDSFIEKYPSSFNNFGTRISLKIKNDFAKKLNYEKIIKIIKNSMAYQSIPIEVECDGNTMVLEESNISVKNGLEKVTDIQIIEINTDLLEGYIVLYNFQHQSFFGDLKLCQQGFKISSNDKSNILKPSWLQFLHYNLNIKKKYLTLKASREKVVENDNFKNIQFEIGKTIINYYKENPQMLHPFLVDGRTNALSYVKEENKFLMKTIFISVYNKNSYLQISLYYLLKFFNGKKITIAIIDRSVNDYFRESKEEKIKEMYSEFESKYYILLNNTNAYWFMQYIDSYVELKQEIIHTYPGVVYTECIANFEKGYEIPIKNVHYSWTNKKCSNDDLFCYVLNVRSNLLEIVLNEKNFNAKLLINNSNDIRVKSLEEIILKNIEQRILNHDYANQGIIDYGGRNVNIWSNNQIPSFQTIGCMEREFSYLLNEFIHKKYSNEELQKMGISNLHFIRENFISWWYKN